MKLLKAVAVTILLTGIIAGLFVGAAFYPWVFGPIVILIGLGGVVAHVYDTL